MDEDFALSMTGLAINVTGGMTPRLTKSRKFNYGCDIRKSLGCRMTLLSIKAWARKGARVSCS